MSEISLSCEELEALHDVIEAARCYWNKHPLARQRATPALQAVNRLYFRLGEQLPRTGTSSERFGPVTHSATGGIVAQLVTFVLDLSREYANKHDPWWADTVLISKSFESRLASHEFLELESALERLGMILFIDDQLPDHKVAVQRRDNGPWPELAVRDNRYNTDGLA